MAHAVNGIGTLDSLSNADLTSPSQLASPVKAQPSPAPQQAASPSQDHVTLSAGAQAAQLLHSGQTVSQISVSLGLPASLVDSYLGITATASSTAAPAASTVSPAVAKAAVTQTKLA